MTMRLLTSENRLAGNEAGLVTYLALNDTAGSTGTSALMSMREARGLVDVCLQFAIMQVAHL